MRTAVSARDITTLDLQPLGKSHWRQTIIASLADLLDSGGIVAGAASYAIWVKEFHLPPNELGLVAAVGANGLSSAIGAWLGGRLCDRWGRKRVYMYDLLLYMLGTLIVIFALNLPMVLTGFILIGFAIGIDIPSSWSLIAELAPKTSRRKLMAVTSLFWSMGIFLIFALAAVLSSQGPLAWRVLFAVLFVIAVGTWVLRLGLRESLRWQNSQQQHDRAGIVTLLFQPNILKWLLFTFVLYGINVLPASMGGDFLPYALQSLHITGPVLADSINTIGPILSFIVVFFLFMPLSEQHESRPLFVAGAVFAAAAWMCLAFLVHVNPLIAFSGYLILGALNAIGEPFLRIWSVELFPTSIRGTCQSIIWGGKKLIVSIWSLFVPGLLATSGFTVIIAILLGVYVLQAVVGGLFAPRTRGLSLETITGETGMSTLETSAHT